MAFNVGATTTNKIENYTTPGDVTAAHDQKGALWGEPATGRERLAAWRAACTLSAGTPAVPSWARRPYLVPPLDALTTAEAAARAAPVITAGTLDEAVIRFDHLMATHEGHGQAIVWDRIPRTSPLARVGEAWLRGHGRLHARLARTRQHALELADVEPAVIPTLADARFLPARWAAVPLPDPVMRRAALSLAVARLAGAGTWADAGSALGIDGPYAARTVRHTLRSIGGAAARELTDAAFAYARSLTRDQTRAERPHGRPLHGAAALRRFARRLAA